ncbi:MAG: hypothetical protein ACTS3F_14665 [Phycisphaerales bacterium]
MAWGLKGKEEEVHHRGAQRGAEEDGELGRGVDRGGAEFAEGDGEPETVVYRGGAECAEGEGEWWGVGVCVEADGIGAWGEGVDGWFV